MGAQHHHDLRVLDLHEKLPGRFDFSGNLDVAVLQIAQEVGLFLIVLPRPVYLHGMGFRR